MDYKSDQDKSRVIEQNRSYHDQAAESYDHTMDLDPKNQLIRNRVREKLTSLLPAGRVLDFGGGTGPDLGWLTAQGYEVLFCEPSELMREKAIQYNHRVLHSNKINFLTTDGADFTGWQDRLPFQLPADAVLSNFGALNYIPDAGPLFRNMARVLRPGGHFVLLILHLPLKKRLKWHRRNALRSLIFRTPYVMYIPYEGNRHQTVFVHTLTEIKKLSAPYFTYISHEVLEKFDFTLIHLIRNEAQD